LRVSRAGDFFGNKRSNWDRARSVLCPKSGFPRSLKTEGFIKIFLSIPGA
jgi:hypothetical protein